MRRPEVGGKFCHWLCLKTCVTSDLYMEYVMWFKSNEYKYYWAHAVLSFYIKLKTAKSTFIKGIVFKRSICMHKMDYRWYNYKMKSKRFSILKWFFSCIFWWPPWSHFHYFPFWYACPIASQNLLHHYIQKSFKRILRITNYSTNVWHL